MATVTVTGVVKDETGRKDSRDWKAFSPVYREGSSGEVVTMRSQRVRVVGGVFTAKLEPGVCVIENPDGQRYTVTVPDTDADLWHLVSAAVAFPPDTQAEAVAAAVVSYLEDHPPAAGDWNTMLNKPAVIAAGVTQAAARSAIGAANDATVLHTTDVGNTVQAHDADLDTIAALSPADDQVLQRKSGVWTNRTPAQLKSDMALNRGDFGLGNVDNTADAAKPVSTATQTALNGKQSTSEKGQPNGYAPLDALGTVAAAYLPSYVDDVLEYANLGTFPSVGEPGKIYTALNTNKIYRWSGSVYIEISSSPGSTDAVTEGAANLYYTNARADARIAAALGVSVQEYSAVLAALSGKASPAGQLVGTTDSQVLTGKTISGASNTLSNIALAALAASGTANNTTYLRGDGQWSAPGSTTPSQFGAYASLPAAGSAGLVYYCTDCDAVFRDNGTTWDRVRFGVGGTTQPIPPTSGWSTTTMGSATVAADKDGRLITAPSAAGDNWRVEYRTLTPTSNYTFTAYIEHMSAYVDGSYSGLVLRNSSSGSMVIFGPDLVPSNGAATRIRAMKWTNATTYSADYGTARKSYELPGGAIPKWFRIRDDGTTRYFEYSPNGIDWFPFTTTSRTDFITPDQIGWGISNQAGSNAYLRTRSFQVA